MKKHPKTYKKGDTAKMFFHGAGVTSKENHIVEKVTKKEVWLFNEDKPWRFNKFNGQCLNDVNDFGFWRELEV
jgi:hypothetical protein